MHPQNDSLQLTNSSDNNIRSAEIWGITDGILSGWRAPRGSVLSSPKSALIFMEWPCQKEWISNRRTASLVLTLVGKSKFTLDIWKIDFQNKLSNENKTWLWTFGTESKISCSIAIKKYSITTRCKFHAVFLNSFVSKSFSEHYKQWTF